jgi:hypothetical protein
MRILAVAGAGSGSGKTALLARLVRLLPDWGALKTSPVVDGGPDHGLSRNYELVLDLARLASPGTDTGAYVESGAARVGWLIARPPLSVEGRAAVLRAFRGLDGILVEGGSLADGLSPDRRCLVLPFGERSIKDSAQARARHEDTAVVVAHPSGTSPEIEALIADVTAWARC